MGYREKNGRWERSETVLRKVVGEAWQQHFIESIRELILPGFLIIREGFHGRKIVLKLRNEEEGEAGDFI
jgi:hypothetical protein